MFLGIDASTYFEVLAKKPRYVVEGKEIEPLSYLHDHNGVNSMRIRLWINPFSQTGEPYHGGTNDWDTYVKLARLAMSKGYRILLDLHYSDFWCDPSKQTLPKSWASLSLEEVGDKVYEYTKQVLLDSRKENIDVQAVQLGNEITNGMLWPLGKINWDPMKKVRSGYEDLSFLLKKASKGAKEAWPGLPRIVHLERSGDKELHEEFYREIIANGVDFDIIGLSYYPYWHGTFDMLFANSDNLAAKFHKPIWIVETGYGFTMAPFIDSENNGANLIGEDFFNNSKEKVYKPYPLTLEGQKEFVEELIKRSKAHSIESVYYWEPLWLPMRGLEWASLAGEKYINETNKPTHNEWANQCLFDYNGNATPALFTYKIKID